MSDQTARAGFKTFIATLCISLLMFGVLYFLLNSTGTEKADIEKETSSAELAADVTTTSDLTVNDMPTPMVDDSAAPTAAGAADTPEPADTSLKDQKAAAFKELTKPTSANVLGAADALTPTPTPTPTPAQGTSSSPNTGSTEVTAGLLFSLMVLGFAGMMYVRGPRKAAISNFERDLTTKL